MGNLIKTSHVGASPRPNAPLSRPATDDEMEIAKRAAKYTRGKRKSRKTPATKDLREKSQKLLREFKNTKARISGTPKAIETTLSKQAKKLGITEADLTRKMEAIKRYRSSKD